MWQRKHCREIAVVTRELTELDKASVVTKTFATRARTIDHLGREQIADAPTAVSELWKNSWDAYARTVNLHLFNEEPSVAVLTDDGHGMREADLFGRWLVIGTESKISDTHPVRAPVGGRHRCQVPGGLAEPAAG
ncbi:Histidine kinase-, DNA gyrase B-, and HSP90-like ATPase [Rhizobium lusitanum]|uniref:Histidine kinase-, DNA gyrase B-, and HSP90-like ATPase n=1 Tax=Rhizobium lusitanum TaxID=293958 RepID=A0A1C3W809_9HYPH|nr:Histidine kinase-, DNA gyrase B-, and HSP90-like ATPase [Rhizobium lusitanum]